MDATKGIEYTPASRATSGDLLKRCRDHRDASAWTELMSRHAPSVYAVARKGFGLASQDADDVFQETFIRIHQHLGRVREPDAIGAYIKQVARRLCIDQLAMQTHSPLPDEEMGGARDHEALLSSETALSIQQALDRLPDERREVIERFFLCDETYATISVALGIPFGTIGSRIARGLERLRAELCL